METVTLWAKRASTGKYTNRAFLCKIIDHAQHMNCTDNSRRPKGPPMALVQEYIERETVLAWDEQHGLFWVEHPDKGWQVAAWMMPAAVAVSEGDDGAKG